MLSNFKLLFSPFNLWLNPGCDFSPDFLRHSTTEQLAKRSLLPTLSQSRDKVKFKTKSLLGDYGTKRFTERNKWSRWGEEQRLLGADNSSTPIRGQGRIVKRSELTFSSELMAPRVTQELHFQSLLQS